MVQSVNLSASLKTFSAKDESNEPSVALYRKGLNEFEKALQVPIPGHGQNQDKANELKSKIRRSVIQIKDRDLRVTYRCHYRTGLAGLKNDCN